MNRAFPLHSLSAPRAFVWQSLRLKLKKTARKYDTVTAHNIASGPASEVIDVELLL
jgi:hypothetical protein